MKNQNQSGLMVNKLVIEDYKKKQPIPKKQ